MLKLICLSLLPTMGMLLNGGLATDSAHAYNIFLQDGSNSALYNDDSDIGFTDWQVNGNNFITRTGWFYRLGDTGTAQSIATLTQPDSLANPNPNPISVTYTNPSFELDLTLELFNNGNTLSQQVFVSNNSGSALDFYLYSYQDLATSNGVGGDTIVVDGDSYTAVQSGDVETITTTVTASILGLTARRVEVDAIDFNDDTLVDKLQFPLSGNTPQLDGTLNASSLSDPITLAYEWRYNLAAGKAFAISMSNNTAEVPWEFSPGLGILLVGIGVGSLYFKSILKINLKKVLDRY